MFGDLPLLPVTPQDVPEREHISSALVNGKPPSEDGLFADHRYSTDFSRPWSLESSSDRASSLRAPREFWPKRVRYQQLSLNRKYVICTLSTYPHMMLPGKGMPPFISPTLSSQGIWPRWTSGPDISSLAISDMCWYYRHVVCQKQQQIVSLFGEQYGLSRRDYQKRLIGPWSTCWRMKGQLAHSVPSITIGTQWLRFKPYAFIFLLRLSGKTRWRYGFWYSVDTYDDRMYSRPFFGLHCSNAINGNRNLPWGSRESLSDTANLRLTVHQHGKTGF